MSKLLISQYLNDLSRLKQASGTDRESVVREAVKDLLKGYARGFKERVIELLTRVSIETQTMVDAMRNASR